MFRRWSGLSWQRLPVVNRGVLGGGVGGVDHHGPLRAAAVFAAAGLVPLATSIPGHRHAGKEPNAHFRMNPPISHTPQTSFAISEFNRQSLINEILS